jgi:ERCC4-related helicase
MRRFAAGEVDVLVATTVIEVGVNVPNATAMVIMDADRFGVSQLHQLRGRVGRGSAPGLCLLVTEMPEASPARGSGSARSRPRSTASSCPVSTWSSAARATSSARPSPALLDEEREEFLDKG